MSDLNDPNVAEETNIASVGEVLKSAREAQQLDIDDVCSYLRLSRRQVIALENNDFAVLPESTITRGFIRNYARMLDLDAEPLLEAYRGFASSHHPRPITIQSENILIPGNDKRSWMMYILASVLIVLLVTAWVIYVDYIPKKSTAEVAVPIVAEQELVTQQEMTVGEVLPDSTQAEVPSTTETPVIEATVSDVQSTTSTSTPIAATSTVSADAAIIQIKASERSWVSITDRNNQNIFDKIMLAGVDETVQGEPPLQVVIGNAPSTTLIFNNQPVDLAPVTKDRVARLKLE
jgi:cytoskeleton protein RodZ